MASFACYNTFMVLLPDYRVRQRDFLLEISRAMTVQLDLGEVLRLILRRAYRRGEIDRNPTDGVIPVKVPKKERTIYEKGELERLFPKGVWEKWDFSPWKDAYDYTAFIVAAGVGAARFCRPGWSVQCRSGSA